MFSQETLFQDCDSEPQAKDIAAVQVSIWKSVATLEFLTRGFDQVSGLLKTAKTTEVAKAKGRLTTAFEFGEHMKRNIS